ncbi:hypothetical protein [Bizionia myxarmorum]|uniref:DUF4760 domain-containing protein n=1 Tax=Bizionia myxarmorum TaxID=291186 RepID=A0A5D0RBX0_9FLAO|nr:hypothetical protein [Bizionia myxarmorum]TYB79170.1 hypothetical protein ES674_05185 [Bizionia myxarmorum]
MSIELIIGLASIAVSSLIGVFGGILTYRFNNNSKTHFAQTEKIESDRMMKELFKEFNGRYDKINNKLDKISKMSVKKWEGQKEEKKVIRYGIVMDFFNICAEEHFWHKEGRINGNIWGSWEKGMNDIYNRSEVIQRLWDEECENGGYKSYYLSNKNEIFKKL